MGMRQINPEGFSILVVCSVFAALSTLGVAMRLRSRRMTRQKLVLSDYSIIAALVLCYTNMVVLGLSVQSGMGRHIIDLTEDEIVRFKKREKLQIALSCIWMVTLTLVKVSILHLYTTIFPLPTFIRVAYIYMAIQIIWGLSGLLLIVLLCRPIQFKWDKTIPGGTCGNYEEAYVASHIIIFCLDFGTAMLPIPILWRFQMATKKKIGVSMLFAIGIVIGAFDLIRIAWRSKLHSPDTTYAFAIVFMFSLLEPELGIFLACLPLCQPVLRAIADSSFITRSLNKLLDSVGSRNRSRTTTTNDMATQNIIGLGKPNVLLRFPGQGHSSVGLRYEVHRLAELESHEEEEEEALESNMEADVIHVTQSWGVSNQGVTRNY